MGNQEHSLQGYIAGNKEVYKFLALLGSVFGWVGSDVYAKITTLEKYLAGDNKEHYQTIKSMIDYEVKNDLIKTKKRDDPSGSRTLLRLHRALEFILGWFRKLLNWQWVYFPLRRVLLPKFALMAMKQ